MSITYRDLVAYAHETGALTTAEASDLHFPPPPRDLASAFYELSCDYMDVVAELEGLRKYSAWLGGLCIANIRRAAGAESRLAEATGLQPWHHDE